MADIFVILKYYMNYFTIAAKHSVQDAIFYFEVTIVNTKQFSLRCLVLAFSNLASNTLAQPKQ